MSKTRNNVMTDWLINELRNGTDWITSSEATAQLYKERLEQEGEKLEDGVYKFEGLTVTIKKNPNTLTTWDVRIV